jgi:MoxR-like ATPase
MTTTLSHAEIRNVLRAAFFTPGFGGRWGLPLLLIGDPGIGKTSMARSEARDAGLASEVLVGSVCDPTDFGGIPAPPSDGTGFARYLLPEWVKRVSEWADGGVLVLDELTCVPPAQQAAMLGLALDGALGGVRLDNRVRIIAACNPPEQAVGGGALPMPMANRFGHLWVQPASIDDWAAILRGDAYGVPSDASVTEADVLAVWDAAYQQAQALVVTFLRRRPELRQRTPKPGSADAEGAWASLRSWEFAMRALAGARIHGLTDGERDALIAGFVGQAPALEFVTWLRDADLPDAADVLDGKVQWSPSPMRPDRTQAVLASCVAVVRNDKTSLKVERGRRLWNILAGLTQTPDLVLEPATLLTGDRDVGALPEATQARRVVMDVARAVQLGGMRR